MTVASSGLIITAFLCTIVSCDKDPASPSLSGSFSLVPATVPRPSLQTGCTIVRESGTLSLTGAKYTLQYEQENRCSGDNIITYGVVDRGNFSLSGSTVSFRSEITQPGTYTGTVDGDDVVVNQPSFGTLRFRR